MPTFKHRGPHSGGASMSWTAAALSPLVLLAAAELLLLRPFLMSNGCLQALHPSTAVQATKAELDEEVQALADAVEQLRSLSKETSQLADEAARSAELESSARQVGFAAPAHACALHTASLLLDRPQNSK